MSDPNSITLVFMEEGDELLTEIANAIARDIDRWAQTPNVEPDQYRAVMIGLQTKLARLCKYLDAFYPDSTMHLNTKVFIPQFWDHSLNPDVHLELESHL